MEETEHARISSGIYHDMSDYPLNQSTESLQIRGVPPAITGNEQPTSRIHEGPFSDVVPVPAAGVGGVPPAAPGTRAARKSIANIPFYRRPGWYKSRPVIICQIIAACLAIALLFILLFPVVRAIAQHVVNVSVLNVQTASIQSPQNGSFTLGMQGTVSHTGIFNAEIHFTEPVDISWINGSTEVPLGSIQLQQITAKSKHAIINQTTSFNISNEASFGEFTAFLITQQNFTWRLQSNGLRVNALKFPVAKGIKFDKHITLNGINNFDGAVTLKDFQLPSDNPEGGINFIATTELNNTSPFQLDLGTVVFNLFYQNVLLGAGTGTNTEIGPGSNDITLNGRLIPHTDQNELASLSDLFTRYLNGELSPVVAQGLSTLQSDNSTISWLSSGIQSLKLNVPFQSPEPINPIQSIDIGFLNLTFTEDTPWSPLTSSDKVQASLQLPFGFGLSIGEIMNNFNLSSNGSAVAGLSTPLGMSTSDISVLNSTNTQGIINITITNSSLEVPSNGHQLFSQFNADLTDLSDTGFRLIGHSRAMANLSIGQITLDPINFNVSSGLQGLRGLKGDTIISGVDVVGGTTDGLQLAINVSIFNPSNLNLNTGDLTLQLFRDGGLLGTTLLPNLTLDMGNNSVTGQGIFQANNNNQSLQTLNDFVGRIDVPIQIAGFAGSTKIPSLLQAFESLQLSATLPGLTTNLLDSASLQILNTTGHENNMSHVSVNLVNPFSADLMITKISSSVSSHGINLGSIEQFLNFSAHAKKTTTSPTLDLNMNLDPSAIFSVTRALAVDAGLDTAQLDGIVQIGGIQYLATTNEDSPPKRRANLFTGFDLPSFVDKAFKQLRSDVTLSSDVTVGVYQTSLEYTQTSVPITTDSSLNLLLPILAQPIVQKIVTGSILDISTVLITDPQQNQFGTKLSGSISNAGPFDATIAFGAGLTISWSGKLLGSIKIPNVDLVGDVGAQLNITATFVVADVDHLTDFTKVLLSEETFEWDISGENLTVSALGIDVPGISLPPKSVQLKGFNGLKDGVTINSFDLPANDPAGGIHLTLDTTVTNPSQVGIQLSSIGFQNFFSSTNLGPAVSQGPFTLSPQSTVQLPLVGRLIPQSSPTGLADVSTIFTSFIHGQDSNVVVNGDSAGPSDVTWLNDGIKSLQIATVLPSRGPQTVIKSVTLDELKLLFTEDTAFEPSTSSDAATAAFQLPFAFPLDITALEQNITAGFQGQSFAQLIIPKGPSTTDDASRVIHLTFNDVPFAVFGDKRSVFQQFLEAVTVSSSQPFSLAGSANADAQTAVGLLSITDISFSVDTSVNGLQGLVTKPTVVNDLDVNHGFSDFLLITVSTSLFNPSNLTIGTGDVSFTLQFEEQMIGTADISGLILTPGSGNYSTNVHYSPVGTAVPIGQTLLENFLQGIDSSTTILGSTQTTPIDSLQLALATIKLAPVIIPALHQNLITSTSLTFPTDIVQTGIASVIFLLSNPFTASINLLEVSATAIFQGIVLGNIDHADLTSTPIRAGGHTNVTSSSLPFNFNLQPTVIIELLMMRSQQNGVSLGPLTDLFQIVLNNTNFQSPIKTTVDSSKPICVSGNQFDVNSAILNALAGLEVTLAVDSSVKLDDFSTELAFNQSNVPAITDESALFLIGAVAPPIVQTLVEAATLTFREANITNLSDQGFDLSLSGSLLGTGPLDALITFTEPVTVNWQGQDIATIALPPVCAAANAGVPDYETEGHLVITDLDAFTSFATFLLHNIDFEWTISTPALRVTALGTIFDNVSLSKTITLKAFDGLPGVMVSNFQLPSDDPDGGIHIETDSSIPSPAQLGIDLGTVGFQAFFENTLVGPLTGSDLFLAPTSVTSLDLSGRIVPQTGPDINTIGQLFSAFLAGQSQTLMVKGQSVQPSGSAQPVSWLSTAFQTLTLQVTLPGQKFTIIQSIDIEDLGIVMEDQDEAFNPLASSNLTLAKYKNPFGFSLQVVQSSQNITLTSGGVGIAELDLPNNPTIGGVSTGNVADLDISFKSQTLRSLNNDAFGTFLAEVADKQSAGFELKGTANVVGRTTVGDVPISGIPFDVESTLNGINSFGGVASLRNVSITGSGGNGGNEFIVSPLTTSLQNPSNTSLLTNDIALPVFFNSVMLGHAAINTLDLIPGENIVQTEFHYEPQNSNDTVAQGFLTEFVTTGDNIPLIIKGDDASTPFQSLQPALEGIALSTSLTGINFPNLITHIEVLISLESLVDNLVSINFDVSNPLDADLNIQFVQSDAGVNGSIFAHFEQSFDDFVVPAKGTANSGTFSNVLLTQGATASLAIIPLGVLDVGAAQTVQIGVGGYTVPWLKIQQTSVPTTYDLDLSLDALKALAQQHDSASSASSNSHVQPSSSNSSAKPSVPSSGVQLSLSSSIGSQPSTGSTLINSQEASAPGRDSISAAPEQTVTPKPNTLTSSSVTDISTSAKEPSVIPTPLVTAVQKATSAAHSSPVQVASPKTSSDTPLTSVTA